MSKGSASAPLEPEVKRFEWCIKRDEFDSSSYGHGYYENEPITSPTFSIGLDSNKSSWSLSLQRLNPDDDYDRYCLSLVPDSKNPSSVDIKFKVGVILKDGSEWKVKQCQIFSGKDVWGYPSFIREYYLYGNENYFTKDELTIFCDLQMDKKIRVPDLKLIKDFSRMFENATMADFTLVVGKEELKVHRAVLASRSPVFEAMFQHDTKEKKDGRVEINDLDAAGMKGLLEFMYSGDVKDLEGIAVKVLPAADKYGVDQLKTLCEKTICDMLTVKNASSILGLADRHSAEHLRSEVMKFINKNSAKVAQEKGFYELAKINPKMFEEIVKSFAARKMDESKSADDATEEPKEKRIKLV